MTLYCTDACLQMFFKTTRPWLVLPTGEKNAKSETVARPWRQRIGITDR